MNLKGALKTFIRYRALLNQAYVRLHLEMSEACKGLFRLIAIPRVHPNELKYESNVWTAVNKILGKVLFILLETESCRDSSQFR